MVDPEGRKVGSFSSDENGEGPDPLTLEGHYTVTEITRPGITCSRKTTQRTSMSITRPPSTFCQRPLRPAGGKRATPLGDALRRYHPDQAH